MALRSITAIDAAGQLGAFDTIIDARSPAEFTEDHLPGAVNWPVLDDEQRKLVGTVYVRQSTLQARKLGAAMAARNIAEHLERWVGDKPREWQPLVYCWRGGQRSGTLAWFLDQIGFRTTRLDGGYKGFRAQVRNELSQRPLAFDWRVITGPTGSGKTRLLQALADAGAQVLDLEALACHRGSILGGVPGRAQPSQKRFDTLLWQALGRLDATRPVFVESESKKIGAVQLPEALVGRMHAAGRCVRVQMNDAARVQLLLQEYGHFADDADRFCRLLDSLVELRGHATVERWQALARAGAWGALFGQLMAEHYDPLYQRSMDRHYAGLATAEVLELPDGELGAMREAARRLLEPDPAPGQVHAG